MTGRPEAIVGRRLREQQATLAVAESCTGGLLAGRITAVPRSSEYFLGGIVAYGNAVKIRELKVAADLLAREGAVSRPVAAGMATGVRRRFHADLGVGITGIAGPGGATAGKPVGLVYIAVATAAGCRTVRCRFDGSRAAVRREAVGRALNMLAAELAKRDKKRRPLRAKGA
jgi:nicotinamide-nucleotide amidase